MLLGDPSALAIRQPPSCSLCSGICSALHPCRGPRGTREGMDFRVSGRSTGRQEEPPREPACRGAGARDAWHWRASFLDKRWRAARKSGRRCRTSLPFPTSWSHTPTSTNNQRTVREKRPRDICRSGYYNGILLIKASCQGLCVFSFTC